MEVVVPEPAGMEDGENEQLMPAGKFPQLRETVEVNVVFGVRVIDAVPLPSLPTVSEVGLV